MKKLWNAFGFLLAVLLFFLLLDRGLATSGWVSKSGYFHPDDFEITRRDHPEAVWHGVVYGSSELISGYREDLSVTGYVNLGMDYATLQDLCTILDGGYITVGDELILALNWGVMWDELDTDPTYIWHKAPLEPYFYFQRDRLCALLRDDFSALLGDGSRREPLYADEGKELYYGHMTGEEQTERLKRLNDLYFFRGEAGYDENLAALDQVIDWCGAHAVRVRAVWMPENPDWDLGDVNREIKARCLALCEQKGVPVFDMTDTLPADCFYDTGHMDYNEGAPFFTKELDEWIES